MSAPADWQQMILREVGAGLDGNSDLERQTRDFITPAIASIWDLWAAKAYHPYLQYLYAKRHAAQMLVGVLRTQIQKSVGPLSKSLNQYFDQIQKIEQSTTEQIAVAEKQAQASRPPAVGQIAATAVIQPSMLHRPTVQTYQDPNDPRYRGSPF